MPNFDKNELPHWADPDDYDRHVEDERLPDQLGDGTHIHSLDRCEHYAAGEEVGWLCGKFPMFTNVATARATGDDEADRRRDVDEQTRIEDRLDAEHYMADVLGRTKETALHDTEPPPPRNALERLHDELVEHDRHRR